jgi:hypothetical protein
MNFLVRTMRGKIHDFSLLQQEGESDRATGATLQQFHPPVSPFIIYHSAFIISSQQLPCQEPRNAVTIFRFISQKR